MRSELSRCAGIGLTRLVISVGARRRKARVSITRHLSGVLFCTALMNSGAICLAQNQPANQPAIKSVNLVNLTATGGPKEPVEFSLQIDGSGFGDPGNRVSIKFQASTSNAVIEVKDVAVVSSSEILASATAPPNVVISGFTITLPTGQLQSPDGFSLALKPVEKASGVKDIVIKHQEIKATATPNLYSMTITKASGDGEFSSDPAHMLVQIFPAEATILSVPYSDPNQVEVRFLAPANFEVKDVYVSVYDSTDLRTRKLISRSKAFQENDPDQPTIKSVAVVDLQRYRGEGRLIITGSGFGTHGRPTFSAEEYASADDKVEYQDKTSDSKVDPDKCESEGKTEKSDTEVRYCMQQVLSRIYGDAKVALTPRNADIPVLSTQIVYMDDNMIDVYFRFRVFPGYSLPFRLSHVDLTLTKPVKKTVSLTSSPTAVVQASLTSLQNKRFLIAEDAGPTKDPNLEFNYTVLDQNSANLLFGKGVADNFYAIEVSVINKGAKKVSIPLTAIQAEVEWASSREDDKSGGPRIRYLEGPATLSPVKLAAVTGFFDGYSKRKSHESWFFNGLQGIVTLATAVFPFAGPSFKDATGVFNSGFIPAARQVFPDLSGQQLQTISGQSWQDVETVAPGGGQVKKFVYIPRGEQSFAVPDTGSKSDQHVDSAGKGKKIGEVVIKKRIKNIMGVDVTAYQVTESEPVSATQSSTTP